MKRPRIVDIASEAGVGTATVERVLNERGNVSPETLRRVVLAARKLGFERVLADTYRGIIRIDVIMMRPDTPFAKRLSAAFKRIAASLDKTIMLSRSFLDETDAAGLAARIAAPGFDRTGLIIVAPDHPDVVATLRQAKRDGVHIVHLASRIGEDGEFPFVGLDNYATGRTAAYYISNMTSAKTGSFVVLCHSGLYNVHRERTRGFSEYLNEHSNANHEFPLVLMGLDDEMRSAELLEDAFRRRGDIIGIYNVGACNAAIASVLTHHRKQHEVTWVGHELTNETRRLLRTGAMNIVFDQAPEIQARLSVDRILSQMKLIQMDATFYTSPFITVTPENI